MEESVQPKQDITQVANTELRALQLSGYFGTHFEDMKGTEKNMLNTVLDWVGPETQDHVDVLWKVKSLENRLGVPPLGQSRLFHLYQFIKLENASQDLDRQKEAFLRK
jgi:hypothetical protein